MKLVMRDGSLIALLLAALLLPNPALGQNARQLPADRGAQVPPGEHLFYAGNSLMWYVPGLLGEMTESAGIQDHVLVGEQRIGASRTLQHWEVPDSQNKVKQTLNSGGVSVLVLSPIQFPDQGLHNFVKLGLERNPKMRFLVQLSWGGGDVDNQDFPKGAWDNVDRSKTPEQLKKLFERNIKAGEAQADELNKTFGKGKDQVLFLVPTAQAQVELRSRIFRKDVPGLTSQGELFVDAAHPSAPLEALNAYLHFAVIYKRSPVGLPIPSNLRNAKKDAWNDALNRTLQEIAWETVVNYPYSGVEAERPKRKRS